MRVFACVFVYLLCAKYSFQRLQAEGRKGYDSVKFWYVSWNNKCQIFSLLIRKWYGYDVVASLPSSIPIVGADSIGLYVLAIEPDSHGTIVK
jgi:hypothetical protein